MKQLLIIPDADNLEDSLNLAEKYSLGFEYNDFTNPSILDNEHKMQQIFDLYASYSCPQYCTMHGAFFDVIPFSPDERIRQVSIQRIEQSIENARKIGAKAVVFHTNYNPFLNSADYVKKWIEDNTILWSNLLKRHSQVAIYLENMFDSSPYIMEELSKNLCGYENFGVCLDYAHATLSKTLPDEWARALGRFVKHVHINDNDLMCDLHLAWGSGKMDRRAFYHSYEKYMGDATVLIETSSIENIRRSLEVMIKDGFL